MGRLEVAECPPVLDETPGLETIVDFFEIDRLLLQGAPKTLDTDAVEVSAAALHCEAHTHFSQRR